MFNALVISACLFISIRDIQTHRISHQSNLLFFLLLLLKPQPTSLIAISLILILSFVASILLGIGGGDFKLFAALTITQGALVRSERYLLGLVLTLAVSTLISFAFTRSLRTAIPLAPALLAPFALSYLAI
jgi:Flp pilus assembly protein protease CpaA